MDRISGKNKYTTLNQATSLFGVSSTTIQNWIKHNYLKPHRKQGKEILFRSIEIEKLKNKITSGEFNRLNKRANKKNSQITFIPDEYLDNKDAIKFVQEIIDNYSQKNLCKEKILLSIATNLLTRKRLFKGKAVQKELSWWKEKTKHIKQDKIYTDLLNTEIPQVNDILGVVYQSLLTEGNKVQNGSYYTPKKIVDEIVNDCVKENYFVLDPCCGTGQFLLCAAKKIKDPNKIWGFELDEIAVRLARLNLMLYFFEIDFEPHIYHKNSLIDSGNDLPAFDVILTNPPWGVHFSKTQTIELQKRFPNIKSGEVFSYFIQQSLFLLKNNGVLSFILPEAILNIKIHRDIREILVKKTSIKKIKYLGRVFKGVFTPVIRLDVLKKEPHFKRLVIAEKEGVQYKLAQTQLQDNTDFIFNACVDKKDINLFEKIYSVKHATLKDRADWAIGIVTGDNKKYITNTKTKTNEPILTGKNIKKFATSSATHFLEYKPKNFQQVAPEHKYRAKEKLVYKFISKELVFSYDDKQTLSLNSANVLIPKIKDYPIKTILGLLNSSIHQFLYQKKFSAIKILKANIEALPFPLIDSKKHQKIEKMVERLLDNTQKANVRRKAYDELDDYVMKLFNLQEDEKKYIKEQVNHL